MTTTPKLTADQAAFLREHRRQVLSARLDAAGARQRYGCPSWCQRADHEVDEVGPGNPPAHYGPTFGSVSITASGDAAPVALTEAEGPLDSTDLLKVAVDTLAAAAWIEAQA